MKVDWAACITAIRSRHLRAGGNHDALDALLAEHQTLYPRMALALFDDVTRQGEVLARLAKLATRGADAFRACNQGAHESFDGDLDDLVFDTDKLAAAVLKVAK